MKIYVDENIPLKIVTRMRAEGYIVDYVTRSVPDYEILESASKEGALLITWDKDFERLVLREGKLQGTCCFLSESSLDVRRPLK